MLKCIKMRSCGPCLEGTQKRHPSDNPGQRTTEPLELIHRDTSGQITPMSLGGASAYVTFTDDATGTTFLKPIRGRSAKEVSRIFKEFKAMVKNQLNKKTQDSRLMAGKNMRRRLRSVSSKMELFMRQQLLIPQTRMALVSQLLNWVFEIPNANTTFPHSI